MWLSGEGSYVLCGLVGRMGMCHVTLWGGLVCIVCYSGEGVSDESCGIIGRAGMMYCVT